MKTRKIRIAVVIDAEGNWTAAGGSDMSAREAMDLAQDGDTSGYHQQYWLNIELPIPQPRPVEISLLTPALQEAA